MPPCKHNRQQSTHPHGVRHNALESVTDKLCFNPRTRMGATLLKKQQVTGVCHPRTRMGCDPLGYFCLQGRYVNPRTRMVTRHKKLSKARSGFNPRTRMGCDAPVNTLLPPELFQSTHPHGVRLRWFRGIHGLPSTHPHGVRRKN